jgi:Uma2 family endonuclease
MGNPEFRTMSAGEFIAWEAEQEERYEFIDAEVVAMTGGTYAHDRVRINLTVALDPHLRGSACKLVGPGSSYA